MKVKSWLLIALLPISSYGFAESTHVYCADLEANVWEWLYDENGDYISIEGQWGAHILDEDNAFGYFSVSEPDYREVAAKCYRLGKVAHPADNRLSNWYLFQVQLSEGGVMFSRGYFTKLDPPFAPSKPL